MVGNTGGYLYFAYMVPIEIIQFNFDCTAPHRSQVMLKTSYIQAIYERF